MPQSATSYKTIAASCGPVLLREKKSKFIAYAFAVSNRAEAAQHLEALWEEHANASHICYAYRIGRPRADIRKNDDGEPAYSAGAPIFGQIEAFGLEDIMLAVVRYYGGVKLGVGGLRQAYRESARSCLERVTPKVVTPRRRLRLNFQYEALSAVMRTIDQLQLHILIQEMELSCSLILEMPVEKSDSALKSLRAIPGVEVTSEA